MVLAHGSWCWRTGHGAGTRVVVLAHGSWHRAHGSWCWHTGCRSGTRVVALTHSSRPWHTGFGCGTRALTRVWCPEFVCGRQGVCVGARECVSARDCACGGCASYLVHGLWCSRTGCRSGARGADAAHVFQLVCGVRRVCTARSRRCPYAVSALVRRRSHSHTGSRLGTQAVGPAHGPSARHTGLHTSSNLCAVPGRVWIGLSGVIQQLNNDVEHVRSTVRREDE
jgi:hypothetical protein